ATPGTTHDFERAHQCPKALLVIGAEQVEISPRRTTAHPEPEPAPRQGLNRLDAMRKLDWMAQRHLQHRGAEFDALGRHTERAEGYERIQGRATTSERVSDPDPREAALFDLPGIVDDAAQCPAARLSLGAHKCHDAQSHDALPSKSFAVTRSPCFAASCSSDNAPQLSQPANSRLLIRRSFGVAACRRRPDPPGGEIARSVRIGTSEGSSAPQRVP